MAKTWSKEEIERLREVRLDPIQNPPEKLVALVTHFKSPGASVFAVTEGNAELHVSKGLARKVRNLTQKGKLDWVLGKPRVTTEEYSQRGRSADRLDPIQQQTLLEKIRDHWAKLKRIIHEDLMDLQVFPPDASQIRQWFAWPTDSSWPVSQGQACREGSGKVSLKLNVQEQEVWKPVRQHLEGHPVLAAIEKWQQATARDIAARLSLFEALLGYAETETNLSVWVSVNEGNIREEGLHNYYIDLLYDQVFRAAVNVGPALSAPVGGPVPITREQFPLNEEGNLCRYNDLLIRGCAEAAREEALTLLLEAHSRLLDIPQAVAAGKAYHEADTQTRQVRTFRSDFLNSGPDPDSRCDECQSWFQALGMHGKGLGG